MPIPFQYFPCDSLPKFEVGEGTHTRVQMAFEWATESAETSITYDGPSEHAAFERFGVLHQAERNVDAYYNHTPISQIKENLRFEAFYNRDAGYFLVRTKRSVARDAFERLLDAKPPVTTRLTTIDLKSVMALGHTTGAYFGNLKIENVRTAAVFGDTTVVESEEWEHYSELGDVSTLYLRVMDGDGEMRTLQFMRDRGVLLMKDSGERGNLEFASAIQGSVDLLDD